MSDSVATPGTQSGSVSGTPPAAEVSAPAPAAFSPEPSAPVDAPATEAAEQPATSVLSEARADAPEAPVEAASEAPAEAASETPAEPEVKAEEPKEPEAKPEEVKAEEPAAEDKPAEPLPLPTYEAFKLPDGVQIDDTRLGDFSTALGEFERQIAADPASAHAAAQEFGQKMVDLYVAEAQAAAERVARENREAWERTREQWVDQLRNDPDIGRNRWETNLKRMGGLMDLYGSHAGDNALAAVRDAFTVTGAGDHPEVVRFVNWAASRLIEAPRPVAAPPVATKVATTRSERLYGKSLPNRGAA